MKLEIKYQADEMEGFLKDRKDEINKVESIMKNINAIARDINVET